MRTTLDINEQLLTEAKAQAARTKVSLTAYIENSLRHSLAGKSQDMAKSLPPLPLIQRSGGFRQGIDPASNRSMFDAADADT